MVLLEVVEVLLFLKIFKLLFSLFDYSISIPMIDEACLFANIGNLCSNFVLLLNREVNKICQRIKQQGNIGLLIVCSIHP